jgi:hypothetical protein
MKALLLSATLCSLALFLRGQDPEKAIRAYFLGYETKDWDMVSSQLSDGFTFTSPAGDDHINLATYKKRCWPTSQHFKKVELYKIIVEGNHAFAIYNITTTENKLVRNTDYYTFSNGKIQSIECFFGPGIGYPGSQNKP